MAKISTQWSRRCQRQTNYYRFDNRPWYSPEQRRCHQQTCTRIATAAGAVCAVRYIRPFFYGVRSPSNVRGISASYRRQLDVIVVLLVYSVFIRLNTT